MFANISLQAKWNRLYARHQRGQLTTDEKLNLLLQTGVDAFNMEIGVISHIHNNTYTILYSSLSKSVCLQYNLSKTYCEATFKSNEILAIEDASTSHPQHYSRRRFGAEAYLGIPLIVKGKRFGTLAFIKGQKHGSFSEGEKSLLRQLARKAESILSHELAEN